MPLLKKLGIAFVFSWFFFGGIGHFIVTDFFTSIVPPYIPYPEAMVYISGVFELLGAVGILISPLRRLAGAGLFLLTLAVSPANINMWLHPDQFAVAHIGMLTIHTSPAILGGRLIVQLFLLSVIVYSTILPERKKG
jgi:uncharacterized membrane protein